MMDNFEVLFRCQINYFVNTRLLLLDRQRHDLVVRAQVIDPTGWVRFTAGADRI